MLVWVSQTNCFLNIFCTHVPYLCDEAEDINLLLLTDTMGTILGLQINLGVPVTIVQDDNIGSDQVDTETSSAGGQQENEL